MSKVVWQSTADQNTGDKYDKVTAERLVAAANGDRAAAGEELLPNGSKQETAESLQVVMTERTQADWMREYDATVQSDAEQKGTRELYLGMSEENQDYVYQYMIDNQES